MANRAAHELPEDTVIRAQEEIASLFRNFINQMEAEVSKRIVVKRTLQKLLNMSPDMAAQRSPIFYHGEGLDEKFAAPVKTSVPNFG